MGQTWEHWENFIYFIWIRSREDIAACAKCKTNVIGQMKCGLIHGIPNTLHVFNGKRFDYEYILVSHNLISMLRLSLQMYVYASYDIPSTTITKIFLGITGHWNACSQTSALNKRYVSYSSLGLGYMSFGWYRYGNVEYVPDLWLSTK